MHGGSEQKTFDAAERELIRSKLIRYMKDNGIGVPTLAERITASHPRKKEILIKTLQRFLAGNMRTNDASVALCHRFAEGLAVSDPIGALGERLAHFYGADAQRDYTGVYLGDSPLVEKDFVGYEVSRKTYITISADAGFWRVKEKTFSILYNAVFDGVLVSSGNTAVVVLKDRLTGLARNYMLWRDNDYLIGSGAEEHFKSGSRTGMDGRSISIKLRKM
jgi:hypothetical protein